LQVAATAESSRKTAKATALGSSIERRRGYTGRQPAPRETVGVAPGITRVAVHPSDSASPPQGSISPLARPALPLQRKLAIGAVNDPLEHEADLVADRVMRMPDPASIATAPSSAPKLQRKCSCGSSSSGECESCKKEKEGMVQRSASSAPPAEYAPPIVYDVLSDPGHQLDRDDRSFFEARFGHDLNHVRVHTDARANASARAVKSLAYATGGHLVFREGAYSPGTEHGRRLIAHELAHLFQQGTAGGAVLNRKECSATRTCCPPDSCSQADADEQGTTAPSTWWSLTINIDVERKDFQSALEDQKFGHTNVRFSESNGKQYTYGFYPAHAIPTENVRGVDGCVNHPDTTHDACIDTTVQYPLKKEQYDAALQFAQNFCRSHHYYGLNESKVSYTCTTFAAEVAKAAGKQLPSSASDPTEVYYQKIPSIDNPNTLNERAASLPQSIGSGEQQILSIAEIWGSATLERYPWQEKARWINILLNETWISEKDVAAVEKLCASGISPTDLSKVRKAVSASVDNMHSSSQQKRVKAALGL
jgi:hypothetical protein